MGVDPQQVLAELSLPLRPGAGLLEAIGVAVALEDGLGVTLPDALIDAAHLGTRTDVAATLDRITPRD